MRKQIKISFSMSNPNEEVKRNILKRAKSFQMLNESFYFHYLKITHEVRFGEKNKILDNTKAYNITKHAPVCDNSFIFSAKRLR